MSYYAYDSDGYVGDAASISGWNAFATWARGQGGELATLANKGASTDVAALVEQLRSSKGDTADAESVRANLLQLAEKAADVFIVTEWD